MTIARSLADHIASVSYDRLPAEAVHWAKVAIANTVGCTLAGAIEPCARIIGRVATTGTSGGGCSVFGTTNRVGPLDAGLINGTAAHALDYDDCSDTLGAHHSGVVRAGRDPWFWRVRVPCRLCGRLGSRGADRARHQLPSLRKRMASNRNDRRVRRHRCVLPFAWPVTRADRRALGLAATFSSGLKANFGTMTKPLHVGHASRNGLLAALLAADGFTASAGAFEHRQGFLEVFNGAGHYDTAAILQG